MLTNTDDLLSMVESLPINIRTKLLETILNSLHPSKKEIDEFWAEEAEKRVKDIKKGKVKTVPLEEIFQEIKTKFNL